jgi:hypothetical protein
MVLTGVGCTSTMNTFAKWTCSAIVIVGVTAGGVYFQPAWANVCYINFQAVENACGQGGGAVQSDFYTTTISRNGQGVGFTAINSTLWATDSLDGTLSDVCSTVGNRYCKTMECTAAVCTG